jgi:hemolysin activation/secretion protein
LLDPLGDWRQRVSLALEQKEFNNKVLAAGTPLVPNLADRPLTLSYSGSIRSAEGERDFRISDSVNLPGDANDSTQAYNQPGARAGAKGDFSILRWNAGVTEQFPGDWTLTANGNGQLTDDALISGEQFGLGGAQSVRGFEERAIANDQGLRTSLELQAPDQASRLGLENFSLHPAVFWDFGHVWRNHALPGEIRHSTIASLGGGIRLLWSNRLSLTADYGVVAVPGAGHKVGDGRLHASLTVLF